MNFSGLDFNKDDVQLSMFARAIALPVRIFILRMIIENGNAIHKKAFYNNTYNTRTIDKHILELKSLGIIKTSNAQSMITYCVDQQLFNQMSTLFNLFFEHLNNSGSKVKQ